jgi:flagellar protein FliT
MAQTLIEYYKAIESGSIQMLEAARQQDWDGVVRCEGACAVLIQQLRERASTEKLTDADLNEKSGIMRRILSNDAQIRYLTEPWLEHCEQNFASDRVLH